MKLLDAHIHIDFYDDIEETLLEILAEGIQAIFVTHLPELFEKYLGQISCVPNVSLALGFHPILASEFDFNKELFQKYINGVKIIGEVGLDYSITSSQVLRKKQQDIFNYICKKADKKILSIHSRQAEHDVLEILCSNKVKKAIFHWYMGSDALISKIIDSGYYFSANPMMLRTNKGRNLLKKIPLDRLLIETDGPFIKYAGKTISPEHLSHVYKEFSDFYHTKDINCFVEKNYSVLIGQQETGCIASTHV